MMAASVLPLPHAYPFLLLDRIVAVDPGVGAVAVKTLACDDPLLAADGRLPPVLLAEIIAQCAGVAAVTPPASGALLARIDRFRTRGGVGAGDSLRVSVRVLKILGATAKVRGVVRVGRRMRAAGDVVISLRPPAGRRA